MKIDSCPSTKGPDAVSPTNDARIRRSAASPLPADALARKDAVRVAMVALGEIRKPAIARRARVGLSTIYAWANPISRDFPTPHRLRALARVFRITATQLVRAAVCLEREAGGSKGHKRKPAGS
jgi:hypothetical protein